MAKERRKSFTRAAGAVAADMQKQALEVREFVTKSLDTIIKDRPETPEELGALETFLVFANQFGCDPATFAMASALVQVSRIKLNGGEA